MNSANKIHHTQELNLSKPRGPPRFATYTAVKLIGSFKISKQTPLPLHYFVEQLWLVKFKMVSSSENQFIIAALTI